LALPFLVVGKIPAKIMMKKGKAPLQTATDRRKFTLPFPPAPEREQLWKIELFSELLKKKIRQWRGGFPNREPRVRTPIDEHNGSPHLSGNHRHE